MDRRRFLLSSGLVIATLSGCLEQERGDTPDATSDGTTTRPDQDNEQEQTETMQPADQHLVLVNMDDEQHSIQITISAADDDVFDRTVDLAANERRRVLLDITEPGTYAVSATVDEGTTETWSINFGDYDIREGSDVFIEINDGHPDIYWEE